MTQLIWMVKAKDHKHSRLQASWSICTSMNVVVLLLRAPDCTLLAKARTRSTCVCILSLLLVKTHLPSWRPKGQRLAKKVVRQAVQ